jgi:hypothetical protein
VPLVNIVNAINDSDDDGDDVLLAKNDALQDFNPDCKGTTIIYPRLMMYAVALATTTILSQVVSGTGLLYPVLSAAIPLLFWARDLGGCAGHRSARRIFPRCIQCKKS